MIRHRVMRLRDLERVLDWAAAEGWNPGARRCRGVLAADPQGFFAAVERDEPVAAISVVNHSPTLAFLGVYICRPERRGRGIGRALWDHALDHANGRTVGLDGVTAQQANYARSGFEPAGRTIRYGGRVTGRRDARIAGPVGADVPRLVRLESRSSGSEKPAYLTAWFGDGATRRTLVLKEQGRIRGCATVRACRAGAEVGPLIAETPEVADALIAGAAAEFGPEVSIDVPDAAQDLVGPCRGLGLAPVFETARMYRGGAPPLGPGIYAVATLELG